MPDRPTAEERFWAKVNKTDSCWLWTAGTRSGGYGQFHADGARKSLEAHRYAWEMANGDPVPSGMCVLHRCDVRLCVNPSHLFLGTKADNVADMDKKGRRATNPLRGEKHRQAILSATDVLMIRARLAAGASQRDVARSFGISQPTVSAINVKRIWRHI